jgi:hypothetical protein
MKLVELKQLKKDQLYRRILDELKVKGLDTLYIKKTETIDYLDIILATVEFLEMNKKVIRKINNEQFENMVIIVIDEILDQMDIQTTEEQIEKIIKLLKNSLLVQKTSKFLITNLSILYKNIKDYFKNICCKPKENDVVDSVQVEINNK